MSEIESSSTSRVPVLAEALVNPNVTIAKKMRTVFVRHPQPLTMVCVEVAQLLLVSLVVETVWRVRSHRCIIRRSIFGLTFFHPLAKTLVVCVQVPNQIQSCCNMKLPTLWAKCWIRMPLRIWKHCCGILTWTRLFDTRFCCLGSIA